MRWCTRTGRARSPSQPASLAPTVLAHAPLRRHTPHNAPARRHTSEGRQRLFFSLKIPSSVQFRAQRRRLRAKRRPRQQLAMVICSRALAVVGEGEGSGGRSRDISLLTPMDVRDDSPPRRSFSSRWRLSLSSRNLERTPIPAMRFSTSAADGLQSGIGCQQSFRSWARAEGQSAGMGGRSPACATACRTSWKFDPSHGSCPVSISQMSMASE
mmetsp:Transcript_38824/g.95537  ORF Transcript_38824/g.95537 Transcript_38824/m.95537 type:complete len:213 (-) Transcript_38824:648-1286(-)